MNRDTKVAGLRLHTAMDVHHPKFSTSSRTLAAFLAKQNLRKAKVLDMGTGTGVLGVIAAQKGAEVWAVDNNEIAVQLARRNAERYNLSKKMFCAESDLFENIPSKSRFDFIVFNPPFFPDDETVKKHALKEIAAARFYLPQRFFTEAHRFLARNGRVIIIVNPDMPLSKIDKILTRHHWRTTEISRKTSLFRIYHILALNSARSPG